MDNVLKLIQSLESVNLYNHQIGHEGAIVLAQALQQNKVVEVLNLCNNNIGNEGAIAFARTLQTNQTLKELNLCSNNIGNEGVIALANVLKTNQTLKELILSCNNDIGNEGVKALAQALQTNKTLKKLFFSGDEIGNESAIALAQALETNQTLEYLYICFYNQIRDVGINALICSLFFNKSLQILILDCRKFLANKFNYLETKDTNIAKKRKQYRKLLRLLNSRFLSDDVLSSTILI